MGTQTDLIAVGRELPVVRFLNDDECVLAESNIPNCYHFASSQNFIRSLKIPVVIQEVRVPMSIDTGAEVSLVSTKFMQDIFPGQEFPAQSRNVCALGGSLINIRGPLTLKVAICGLTLQHPFYFYDTCDSFLLGFDLVSTAALIIDSANCCVWSKHTRDVQVIANCPHVEQSEMSFGREALRCPSDSDSESLSPQRLTGASTGSCPRTGSRLSASVEGACPSTDELTSDPLHSNDIVDFDLTFPKTASSSVNVPHRDNLNESAQVSDCPPSVTFPAEDQELPEHVSVLFLTTLEENNLSENVARDIKTLLFDHQDTFAKSTMDLGFFLLLKHDIDTGDARPIRQSPPKAPLAAREAEDEILNEMLDSGV